MPDQQGDAPMKLNDVKNQVSLGNPPGFEVHGIDPSIYLIFVLMDGERRPIVDERGQTLKFRSRSRAFDALRDVGVQRAEFVHKSAFDEMVGVGNGMPTEHREQVNLAR